MEEQTRGRRAAVEAVPEDGHVEPRGVETDLVRPPGAGARLDEVPIAPLLEDGEVGVGVRAPGIERGSTGARLRDAVVAPLLARTLLVAREEDVALLHVVALEGPGQVLRAFGRAREEEDARGLFVEAMVERELPLARLEPLEDALLGLGRGTVRVDARGL